MDRRSLVHSGKHRIAGIGIWPEWLFPLVWVAPLLLITGLQLLAGEQTIFTAAEKGDWTALWLAPVAALICGFCWEMWNSGSLVHWEYAVPSVHRFKLFEMPLLGYAGYLPFGLECLAIAMFVFPQWRLFRPSEDDRRPVQNWRSDCGATNDRERDLPQRVSLLGEFSGDTAHVIGQYLMRLIIDADCIPTASDFLATRRLKELCDDVGDGVLLEK